MRERSCPRCQGMLHEEVFLGNEVDLVCIQCGYRAPLVVPSLFSPPGGSQGRRRSRRDGGLAARRAA